MKGFSKRLTTFIDFLVELLVYAGFVVAYFLLVLHVLGDKIKHVYDLNPTHYALLAVALIAAQGFIMERLTTFLMWLIRCLQAILPVLYRLATPYESSSRPAEAPGLLVYRFAGPLYYFNAAYFAHRVNEVIAAAESPVRFFLVNAEAIVDMDMNAVEILEEMHRSLRKRGIVLGFCEVKGDFRRVLANTRLAGRAGFKLFPSVATAVRQLSEKPRKKQVERESSEAIPG